MNLATRLRRRPPEEERAGYVEIMETWKDGTSHLPTDFRSYVQDGLKSNGVVFAVMLARLMLFGEVSFAYRDDETGEWAAPPLVRERVRV
jgi:hypothetical protein